MPSLFSWKLFSSNSCRLVFATIATNIGAFNIGFGVSYTSPIISEVTRLGLLTDRTLPIFTASIFLGAALGSLISFQLILLFGRKAVIQTNTLVYSFGWLLVAFGTNASFLIVGRLLGGVAIGVETVVAPIYIGELVHHKNRALYTNSFSLILRSGIVVAYTLGIFLSFRSLALVPVFLSLIQACLMFPQPYSPAWLLSRNLEVRAFRVLESLRQKGSDIRQEVLAIQSVLRETEAPLRTKLKWMTETYHLKALVAGLLMVTAVQCTGVPVYLSYASQLYSSNKILDVNTAPILLGVFMILGTLIASCLFDRMGRKMLTVLSAVGTVICHVCLGICYRLIEQSSGCQPAAFLPNNHTLLSTAGCLTVSISALVSLNSIFFLFGIGWGSLLWVLLAELFPIRVKTIISSLVNTHLWLVTFVIALLWPYLEMWFGTSGAFFIFAFINTLSLIFVVLFIPETKGKKVEEIEKLFQENIVFCDPLYLCRKCQEECSANSYVVATS